MASWIPPIPGGKLTSKPVRQLGSAVTFLHWCYEAVRRDGTIEFQIAEVADYLEESYYTVRKWWSLVKDGPWFCEVIDRGKRGFYVKMHSDWLEWRAVKSSSSTRQVPNPVLDDDQEKPAEQSNAGEMHDQVLEEADSSDQMPVKLRSNENEVPDRAFDDNAYKVLQTDQESHVVRRRASAPDEPPTPKEIREAIAKGSQIDLKTGLKADIVQVNNTAKRLWDKIRKPDQSVESLVAEIRSTGRWIRQTQYPYKDSDQRIPPSALIKFWPAAAEARNKDSARTSLQAHVNGTNGTHDTGKKTLTREQLATLAAGHHVRTSEQS